jgi:hypothetical protein
MHVMLVLAACLCHAGHVSHRQHLSHTSPASGTFWQPATRFCTAFTLFCGQLQCSNRLPLGLHPLQLHQQVSSAPHICLRQLASDIMKLGWLRRRHASPVAASWSAVQRSTPLLKASSHASLQGDYISLQRGDLRWA